MVKLKLRSKVIPYVLSAALLLPPMTPASLVSAQVQESPEVVEEQQKKQDWQQWISENIEEIDTLEIGAGDFEDLQFLKELLQNKKFVMLGESSHGAAEFNLAKVRLIEFLHKEMDFDVLAFESGLGETSAAYTQIHTSSAEDLLKNSVYPVWHTQEVLPLFEYMKMQSKTSRPLELTGFDMQPSYKYGEFLERWFEAVDSKIAQEAKQLEKTVTDMYGFEVDLSKWEADVEHLVQSYDTLMQFVEENEDALNAVFPKNDKMVTIVKRVFENRQFMLQNAMKAQIAFNAAIEQGEFDISESLYENVIYWRDRMMAETLVWLTENVYPEEKMIIWGHNYHLRKNNSLMTEAFDVHPHQEGPVPTMGELLPYKIKRQSYSIGLFMNQGETLGNDGSLFPVQEEHDPHSIESILGDPDRPYSFIDLSNVPLNEQTSWMFTPRQGLYWGFIAEVFVPTQQYDGILMIDRTKGAQYID